MLPNCYVVAVVPVFAGLGGKVLDGVVIEIAQKFFANFEFRNALRYLKRRPQEIVLPSTIALGYVLKNLRVLFEYYHSRPTKNPAIWPGPP